MTELISAIWEENSEVLEPLAPNIGIGADTPNDRLIIIYLAHNCGLIKIDDEYVKDVQKMMTSALTTGYVEGLIPSALDDPDFTRNFF